uniref:Rhomboid domain containing 1 n=1 Tax=Sphaeramia orbicularis TaxID=375764 RepID=A0A672ZCD8_9TELE
MRPRQRGSHLGLLLLASQLIHVGFDNIPPVTLAVLGLNAYLYLFPAAPLMKACVSVQQAYWYGDWRRLLLSPLHHADDMHLYFNMVSFLWKGMRLERRLGGAWFLYLLSVFSLLTGLVYLLLEAGLTELMQDQSYSMTCAVGFSGVLFGLKVLSNHYYPGGVTYMMGIPVSNRYPAGWMFHQLRLGLCFRTSFIGHLAGILFVFMTFHFPTLRRGGKGIVFGSVYNRTNYTASYTGGLSEEEQLEAAIRNSLNDRGQRHRTERAEEIRWRRLRRFDS